MRAVAVFPKAKQVKLIEIDSPKLSSPSHVLIQMLRVGVCGTDREIAQFQYGTPPKTDPYLVLGHESLGRVIQVGKNVKKIREGDLVVPTVRRPCPQPCISCAYHESDMCYTGDFVERGIKEAHGYMTEQIVEHEDFLAKVPPHLEAIGVLLEPLTISEKAARQILLVQQRLHWECAITDRGRKTLDCRNALVLGAGPVGILAALVLAAKGIKTHVVSMEEETHPKIKMIRSMDIGYFQASRHTPETIAQELKNVDVIFEAAGSSKLSFQFLPALGVNGIYVLSGVPGLHKGFVIDEDFIMRNMVLKNQVLLGTVNANITAFENGIAHLNEFDKKYPKQMRQLITHRFGLAQFEAALGLDDPGRIKVVLEIGKVA